jgi:hypothetical protein
VGDVSLLGVTKIELVWGMSNLRSLPHGYCRVRPWLEIDKYIC